MIIVQINMLTLLSIALKFILITIIEGQTPTFFITLTNYFNESTTKFVTLILNRINVRGLYRPVIWEHLL